MKICPAAGAVDWHGYTSLLSRHSAVHSVRPRLGRFPCRLRHSGRESDRRTSVSPLVLGQSVRALIAQTWVNRTRPAPWPHVLYFRPRRSESVGSSPHNPRVTRSPLPRRGHAPDCSRFVSSTAYGLRATSLSQSNAVQRSGMQNSAATFLYTARRSFRPEVGEARTPSAHAVLQCRTLGGRV